MLRLEPVVKDVLGNHSASLVDDLDNTCLAELTGASSRASPRKCAQQTTLESLPPAVYVTSPLNSVTLANFSPNSVLAGTDPQYSSMSDSPRQLDSRNSTEASQDSHKEAQRVRLDEARKIRQEETQRMSIEETAAKHAADEAEKELEDAITAAAEADKRRKESEAKQAVTEPEENLKELDARTPAWLVDYTSVRVRRDKDGTSETLAAKTKGTVVYGYQEGDWLRLGSDAPGYIRIVDADGMVLLKKMEAAPTCPDCHDLMLWSESCGSYSFAWTCNNFKNCGSTKATSGVSRWFCRRCQNNLCNLCKRDMPKQPRSD